MKFKIILLISFFMFTCTRVGFAQNTGLLYDPEPPADSGYVRIFTPIGDIPEVSVSIDSRLRLPQIKSAHVSDYLVVKAGKHTLSLQSLSKSKPAEINLPFSVNQGEAITVALKSYQPKEDPIFFVDKKGSNKLKSMLSVYQLGHKTEQLDILSSNGKTKVFSNMAYGSVTALQVNPIKIDLMVSKSNDTKSLSDIHLEMTQGSAYSVFIIPDTGKIIKTQVIENKIEKFSRN